MIMKSLPLKIHRIEKEAKTMNMTKKMTRKYQGAINEIIMMKAMIIKMVLYHQKNLIIKT